MMNQTICVRKNIVALTVLGVAVAVFVLIANGIGAKRNTAGARASGCGGESKCADGTAYGHCSEGASGIRNGYKCICTGKPYAVLVRDPAGCPPVTPTPSAVCKGTCAGGTAIGSCAPGSTKLCQCSSGFSYPTYKTDTVKCNDSVTTPAPSCSGECADGVKIGSCRAGYLCVCQMGSSYPKFVRSPGC